MTELIAVARFTRLDDKPGFLAIGHCGAPAMADPKGLEEDQPDVQTSVEMASASAVSRSVTSPASWLVRSMTTRFHEFDQSG